MLVHPQFDPIAVHIGSGGIHWYGLMYLVGFAQFLVLGRLRLRALNRPGWDYRMLDDLLFYAVIAVIAGARLGEVLFYNPAYYWAHPPKVFAVWEGGMSFHGGFIAVLLTMAWFARKRKLVWLELTDFIAPLAPLGLAAGRFGNFINGELWGRPTDLPWGMWFPQADKVPLARHPSQLYELALEGLALFAILWLYSRRPRPAGAVSGLFLIGYGTFRFVCEFARNPDTGIFGQTALGVSMGQWLSLPMLLAGIALMAWAYKRRPRSDATHSAP